MPLVPPAGIIKTKKEEVSVPERGRGVFEEEFCGWKTG